MLHRSLFVGLVTLASSASQAVPTVHTNDFIVDSSRIGFNGFENAPVDPLYGNLTGSFPYSEGGISVTQVNGEPPGGMWMTCGAIRAKGYCFGATGHEGKFSWYPNGGDTGYTKITRSDGLDFGNVGFLTGNGYTTVGATYIRYELLNNGTTVLLGQLLVPQGSSDRGYLGFGGGGFDEIHVQEESVTGGLNLLALDSIEMSALPVPEPSTVAMLAVGLAALCITARRRIRR